MSYPYPTVLMPYWRRSGGADASGVIEDASGLFDTSAGFANMEPGLNGCRNDADVVQRRLHELRRLDERAENSWSVSEGQAVEPAARGSVWLVRLRTAPGRAFVWTLKVTMPATATRHMCSSSSRGARTGGSADKFTATGLCSIKRRVSFRR